MNLSNEQRTYLADTLDKLEQDSTGYDSGVYDGTERTLNKLRDTLKLWRCWQCKQFAGFPDDRMCDQCRNS